MAGSFFRCQRIVNSGIILTLQLTYEQGCWGWQAATAPKSPAMDQQRMKPVSDLPWLC